MSPTPILDLEEALPKARAPWTTYFVALPIALAVVFAPMILEDIWDDGPSFNGLLFLPGLYIAIFIHELGHVIAGRLAGLPTGALSVGGFVIARSGAQWAFRFDGRRCLIGGFMVPMPATSEFNRNRFACLVAGGPIAGILFTAACWFAFDRFGDGAGQWISTLFWTAAMVLVPALMPYGSQGALSDMARLLDLYRRPEQSRRWMALISIQSDEMKGVRPRDWNSELMESSLQAGPSEALYLYAQLFASYREADLGKETEALQYLENALGPASRTANKRAKAMLFQWAASLSASLRKNPAQSRVWLERAQKLRGKGTEGVDGIEAEIAIVQGRYADALVLLEKYREWLRKRRADSGLARFAKERIEQRESLCRACLSQAASAS